MNFEIEHDACGIGTVVQIDGKQSYDVVDKALHIVEKLEHRAGKDASGKVGNRCHGGTLPQLCLYSVFAAQWCAGQNLIHAALAFHCK